jgi:hypothetical protein
MDPILQDQADLHALINADATFAEVTVLLENKGDIESDVLQGIATLNEKAGKLGAIAVVLEPEEVPTDPETPNPELRVRLFVQVLEDQIFNTGATGTGKSAFALARRVRQIGHRRSFGRGVWYWVGTTPAPQDSPTRRSRLVTFERRDAEQRATKLGAPLIDPESGATPQNVTLTPPDGAAIWYTLDGSTPIPNGPTAVLYEAPIAIAAACTLRCAAYLDGAEPSNIAEATYT